MVLYRKYRPQTFDEVIGQDHVVTTLKNALASNKVAHAYLFAGPRGIGKTTVARILAKDLGVQGLDLIEIDAASHRGIDDVRELRQAVNFLPTQSPKKFYILDEAHMLTREAFNALLKTLEEPPWHVHFVLCTTEPHKLPLTILSRCQRFDFNLADEETLRNEYIEVIAQKEKIKLDLEVSKLIAQLAQGSFRDALTFLESLSHHAGEKKLELRQAQKILGLVDKKEAQEINLFILQKNLKEALPKIQKLGNRGVNFHHLIQVMIESLREELSELLLHDEQATPHQNLDELLDLIKLLHQAEGEVKDSTIKSLPLEMVTVEWGLGKREDRRQKVEDRYSMTEDRKQKEKREQQNQSSVFRPQNPPSVFGFPSSSSIAQTGRQPQDSGLQAVWSEILASIKPHNHSVEALLKGCEPISLSDNILTLRFFYRFHKERIEEDRNRKLVERVGSEVLGRPIEIHCLLDQNRQNQNELTGNLSKTMPNEASKDPIRQSTDAADWLKMAQEVFGGEIIE